MTWSFQWQTTNVDFWGWLEIECVVNKLDSHGSVRDKPKRLTGFGNTQMHAQITEHSATDKQPTQLI